jgi:CRISPR-associated endonuclease Csn1
MGQNMKYRLALDLGPTSLGWAIFLLDQSASPRPKALVKAGSRIFPNSRRSEIGRQHESLAKVRREKRQARRRRDRFLTRRDKLIDALIKYGLFPEDIAERKALELLNPYDLRARGLTEKLPLHKFGRALFHLNQRRGFKSNRKTDSANNDDTPIKGAVSRLHKELDATNSTVGAWLNRRRLHLLRTPNVATVRARHREELRPQKRDPSKTTPETVFDFFVDRAMVTAEFDALWAAQAIHHGNDLPEEARVKIRDIIFFQRKLRPVSPGRCSILTNLRRAYKAFPVVQQLRIFQEVNHLEILDVQMLGQSLSVAQRDCIARELLKGRDLTFDQIRKLPGFNSSNVFNLENGGDERKGLVGDETAARLKGKEYFGKRWLEDFDDILRHRIVWKLLHAQDPTALHKWLQLHSGLTPEVAERVAKVTLPSGVSAYSRRVSGKLLYQLQLAVVPISNAVFAAGFGSHSGLSHFEKTGEILPALPYYGQYLQRHVGLGTNDPADPDEAKRWGRIANPTVHVGLNQIRTVVNAAIKKYGATPTEIVVELSRELKLNKEQTTAANVRNFRNRKERDRRRDRFVKEFHRRPSDDDLDKFLLWEELNPDNCLDRCCPYSGRPISIRQLFESGEVAIEHILPKRYTIDDGLNNKTVAYTFANNAKADRTPHEAFGQSPTINGVTYSYEAILHSAKRFKMEKSRRFAADGLSWWLGLTADGKPKTLPDRLLNDTKYMSRVAREYLTLICPSNRVWVTSGRLTHALREEWQLDALLGGRLRKNRNDHRHHAIDACVIGVTDRWLVEQASTASARAATLHLNRLFSDLSPPWPSFFAQVERAIGNVKVSHKPDHSFEDSMFKETTYGIRPDGSIIQRKRDPEKKDREVSYIIPITEPSQEERHGLADDGKPRAYKGYAPDGNYCMEILRQPSGEWTMAVIPTFGAYSLANQLGWNKPNANRKQILGELRARKLTEASSGDLVTKLIRGDTVLVNFKGADRLLFVSKMSVDGGVTFTEIHEANVSGRYTAKLEARKKLKKDGENSLTHKERFALRDEFISSQIGVEELRRGNARKVTISPLGDVRDPGFKG